MRTNKKDNAIRMADAMESFKNQKQLSKGLEKDNVEQAWEKVMGPGIMSYTVSLVFRNNTLTVNLSSSVLREELMYGRTKIVQNLNEYLGAEIIEKIILR